jgi:hypothetical protein
MTRALDIAASVVLMGILTASVFLSAWFFVILVQVWVG